MIPTTIVGIMGLIVKFGIAFFLIGIIGLGVLKVFAGVFSAAGESTLVRNIVAGAIILMMLAMFL